MIQLGLFSKIPESMAPLRKHSFPAASRFSMGAFREGCACMESEAMMNGSECQGDMAHFEKPQGAGLQRRIQRHVAGRVHRFLAVAPPQLAALCKMELRQMGLSNLELTEAGVEFQGKLRDAYAANLWLRTAGRVVCRLGSFRGGTQGELFHKTAILPWELWLNPEIPLKLSVLVERSRVSHEGLVRDSVVDAIQKRFKGLNFPFPRAGACVENEWQQRLWVHLRTNHCLLSLDTTGPHLHERGYRLLHSGAPLRETLAAAILLQCGWSGDIPLVDGMCGAGTFAIEGALIARRKPPGLGREFLFERWPSFQMKTWNHLQRKGKAGERPAADSSLFALDLDAGAIAAAGQNAQRAGVGECIHFENMDFFQFDPARVPLKPGLLVLNPPYGKRLEMERGELYRDIGVHMRRVFRGWRFGIVVPHRKALSQLSLPASKVWSLPHGGLKVSVVLGRV